jgi:hypothetical protein
MRRAAARLAPLLLAALARAPAGAGGLPDLVVSADDFLLELDANVLPGDVAEGCAAATTGVDLLRFSTTTANVGSADLPIGDPMCPSCEDAPDAVCGNPDFHCSPADGHGHPHFTDYARYELFDPPDLVNPVRTGGKFGFCLRDTTCPAGVTPVYDCEVQGLTAGCEDLYARSLGCQYIDVTGLAPGDYVVRVTADPEDKIAEEDETNNASSYLQTIEGAEEAAVALPGTSLELRATGSGTRIELAAKGDAPFALPSPPVAPVVRGATLAVGDGASSASFELPAGGWKGLGKPPGAKGYRYRGGRTDACRSVRLTPSRVRARCTGADVALPVAGPVTLELVSGGARRYCASFGGFEKRNDAQKLKRVGAVAAPCPAP